MKKRLLIGVGLFLILIVSIFLISEFYFTGKTVIGQEVQIVPLSSADRQKVTQILESSEFIKDVPKKRCISLRFFDFRGGERIWQDGFLIERDKLSRDCEPDIYLILHTKYISEMNENNLCEVIKGAKSNGDLGFHSEYSRARLFIRYAGMLKWRGCFGF